VRQLQPGEQVATEPFISFSTKNTGVRCHFWVSPFTRSFLEADPEIFPFLSPNIIHHNWQFPHGPAGDFTAGFHLEQMTNGVIDLV
jgi:hypothetical protein